MNSPKDPRLIPTSEAAAGVDYCNRLFALEKKVAQLSPKDRQSQHQEVSKPLLDAFFAWADSCKLAVGTALAKAVVYARSEKKYLLAFLENPLIPISNNRAENAIRPLAVGRKQWLFCNSVKGAKASAVFYSLAATAHANGINVEQYFIRLFQILTHSANPITLRAFLPPAFAVNSV